MTTQGSTRLVKGDTNNRARDDVAAALLLAAGLFERTAERASATGKSRHVVV